MPAVRRAPAPCGFSLVEVVVATGLFAAVVAGLAPLLAASVAATAGARATTEASTLAWQKVEQLRSLAFGSDEAGRPVTETSADTATMSGRAAGGTGLTPSVGALDGDTPGYVDYLDALGESLGGGPVPPPGTRYRRRWAIDAAGPDQLLVRVRVLAMGSRSALASVAAYRTRKAP